jgi:bacillithiol synthase
LIHRIVTGQQIGLLGGPLFTTYKVLGTVYHAREINGKAIYWLETNDADFSEINHIDYIDAQNTLRTLTWNIDSQGYSCGLIEVDQQLIDLLQEFFETIRQTDFTPALRDMALSCYTPGRTLGEASIALAQTLFGTLELEFFDPSTQAFKDFMQPFLLREAERTKPGSQCNLFCMIGKRRAALFKNDDDSGYRLRDGSLINLDDHGLVPNMKTRPMCQDAYFQASAYIAGPGEQEYLGELDDVYRFHGVKQAKVIPRMSATLLEPKIKRLLKKHGLTLEEILALEKPDLRKQVLKSQTGFDYNALSQQSRQFTDEYLENLKTLGIDLGKAGKQVHQLVKEQLGKLRAEEKAKTENILQAVENLSDLIRPFGQQQERVFNLFYYMNLYGGTALIGRLYREYTPEATLMSL